MSRTSLLALVLLAVPVAPVAAQEAPGVEARAAELEERVHDLGRGTSDLDSRVMASYRRVASLMMELRGDERGAAVLRVTQHNHVGPFYRLVEATYALDGRAIMHHRDPGVLDVPELEAYSGPITPGEHRLTVTLRYVGEGGELFQYVRGYRFTVRSSHAFTVPGGQQMTVRVDAFEHADRPYTERLDVVYIERLDPLR